MKIPAVLLVLGGLLACTGAREVSSAPLDSTPVLATGTSVAQIPLPPASAAPPGSTAPVESQAKHKTAAAERNPTPLRDYTDWSADDDGVTATQREEGAIRRRQKTVQKLFDDAGVSFPARELYLRVFKEESRLEVWANGKQNGEMKPIATYGICKMSGELGPKRHEGDYQVPEGFYHFSFLNNGSNYHLAMKVSYPNAFDRKLSPKSPGGEIMVHGNCVSIGCIAISDERIEELWTMVRPIHARNEQVQIDIFPSREIDARMKDPKFQDHLALWTLLSQAMHSFDETHLRPSVHFDNSADYVLD